MPYTYLSEKHGTEPTGNKHIDESWQALKKITGWDYRVSRMYEITGFLWWKKRTEVFTIFVPCGESQFGGEFGINDMNGRMLFHAPEPIALAFLEGLHWGAVDERQRNNPANNLLLLAQSTQRLQELHRLEKAMEDCKRLLKTMWPYYWGPKHETLRVQAKDLVGE